ncbi:MAG TPA: DUF92 domain-containing protein [Terracidiphilus sp.]|jgi:uncharacterized protein (TIGR00297 family)|nr:DUF92 domain-containing protein [Terracidiphilus sp.]
MQSDASASFCKYRYHETVTPQALNWQSKLVLLLVVPCIAVSVVLQAHDWSGNAPAVTLWTLGLSALLGLAAWKLRAGMPAAAATGALLTASLMFSAAETPFQPWRSAILPIVAFMVLTSLATRFGRDGKQRLGTAEQPHGRGAAQVAANLGLAALIAQPAAHLWIADCFPDRFDIAIPFFVLALAALAEAAADTVSSELGQVLGGRPFLLTTLRRVDPGTDGAISLFGTLAGIAAAAAVAATGTWALHGNTKTFLLSCAGGVFGLFFDSLLGATLERWSLLNNDAVNFLSTVSAAAFTMLLLPRL